jgi:hypothetical protein
LAPTSVVRYDGVDRAPVFVDSTRLELTLNSSELTPGSHPVTVFNSVAAAASLTTLTSSAAAMASNEMSLTVTNPAPVISDIQPGRGLRGVASDVTIIGSGFASSSTVQVDGTTVSSTFVEASGALIAAIPASSAEFRLITVTNALPGGGLGNSVMFQEDLNQAPVVNAGPNQKITAPGSADLTGSVTDDGLPSGILTTSWIKVSGPGDVTFSNANAPKTAATFSAYGAYVLRLSASDSALVSSADITITVGDINLPQPCVSQISGVVTLVAIATDDERVVGLQFKLDGSNFGPELPTEPYRLAWNTLNTPNGCHTLTAIAWDPEGNIGVSAPLSVTVNNP